MQQAKVVLFQKVEHILNTALHIVLNNFDDKLANNITITEVESEDNPSLMENIKIVIGSYSQLNVRFCWL